MIEDVSKNSISVKRDAIEKEKYVLHFDGIEEYMNVRLSFLHIY